MVECLILILNLMKYYSMKSLVHFFMSSQILHTLYKLFTHSQRKIITLVAGYQYVQFLHVVYNIYSSTTTIFLSI